MGREGGFPRKMSNPAGKDKWERPKGPQGRCIHSPKGRGAVPISNASFVFPGARWKSRSARRGKPGPGFRGTERSDPWRAVSPGKISLVV